MSTQTQNSSSKSTSAAREERVAQLRQLAEKAENLTGSELYKYRQENAYHMVFGEGDPQAAILFIGEAPGKSEAEQGRPFVGASGRLLNEMLQSIGLQREDVYITNVVKDRPPENRDPKPAEIALYTPILTEQIKIIRPKVIAPLGRFAMDFVFELFGMESGKISKLRGTVLTTETSFGTISVVPLYHPAVALYRRDQRDILFRDFETLKQFI